MNLVKYLFLVVGFAVFIFNDSQAQETINWVTWEEAVKLAEDKKNDRKVFVDVYTDWCGWCKRMDRDTFNHPDVAKYMNEKYIMVKLDAQQKEDIIYKEKTFKYREPQPGKRGYHELAIALLNGRLSFPTVVFLNKDMEILTPVASYLKPDIFYKIASYYGENEFNKKTWEEYEKDFQVPFAGK